MIEVRQAASPAETRGMDTAALRAHYLVQDLFRPGDVAMCYAHLDRTVIGGAVPGAEALPLPTPAPVGSPSFLDRREMGVANLGGPGSVSHDGATHALGRHDIRYLPKGTRDVAFHSDDAGDPARLYFVSTPAHAAHPARTITPADAILRALGTPADANVRSLRQYIHPELCPSCQLTMGITLLEEGSVWNTMPCHTHDRRCEAYLYFDMAPDTRVLHLMGEPTETRHLVVANEQAILSPGWSIHSGAGTARYGFVWSMAGDNQDFDDMDFVAMEDLR